MELLSTLKVFGQQRTPQQPKPMQVGIHHITGITRNPARNVGFYSRDLGLRLIKKTVNFDYAKVWQIYFGNESGHPGTVFSFFGWTEASPGRNGAGMASELSLSVPQSAIGYWRQRLSEKQIQHDPPEMRFGTTVLPLRDPDGTRLELVATPDVERLPAWSNGEVPPDCAVRGIHGVTLWVENAEPTVNVLTGAFGFCAAGREGNVYRLRCDRLALGATVDVRVASGFPAGRQGGGSISSRRLPRCRRCRAKGHHCLIACAGHTNHRSIRSILLPLSLFPRARWRAIRSRHRWARLCGR